MDISDAGLAETHHLKPMIDTLRLLVKGAARTEFSRCEKEVENHLSICTRGLKIKIGNDCLKTTEFHGNFRDDLDTYKSKVLLKESGGQMMLNKVARKDKINCGVTTSKHGFK